MDDLITWLRACLDDDERWARWAILNPSHTGSWEVTGDGRAIRADADDWAMIVYDDGAPTLAQAQHIARWDPARVLAEIDAKRRIIDECDSMITGWTHEETKDYGRDILKALAVPYAARPGYRDEWRP